MDLVWAKVRKVLPILLKISNLNLICLKLYAIF